MASTENFIPKEEIKKAATASIEGISDAASKIVQEATEKLVEFSRTAAQTASTDISTGIKKSTSFVKKYPLESALVCFGVGVVAGMLLKKRD